MKNLHNVEKSGFRKGEYIGYACASVWKIKKNGTRWHAVINNPVPGIFTWCESNTLAGISEKLEAYNTAWNNNGRKGA